MIAFWQARQSLEQKGVKRINGSPLALEWGCHAAEINWGVNQCLAPSVKRGKIYVCLTICDLIGQRHDTWSNWPESECKPRENLRILNDLRPNWSIKWHLIWIARPRGAKCNKNQPQGLWVKENLTNNHIKDASKIKWRPNLPFHLCRVVGADETNNWLKLFRGVLHKLSFESFLFSTIGPKCPLN